MKLSQIFFLCFLFITGLIPAQDKLSRADILFLEYKYELAVKEYLKEMREIPLTRQQYLNLAESYLKLENFEQSGNAYMQVYAKDSVLPAYHLNNMLVAWKMTKERGTVRKYIEDHAGQFLPELRENALFNFDLQESNGDIQLPANIFNLNDNSRFADFSPSFYRDQLLFTSARRVNASKSGVNEPASYLNIFIAKLDPKGNILATRPFDIIPRFNFHQGTPFYSETLDAVFYIRSNEENGDLVFDDDGKNSLTLGSADRNGNFRFLLKDLSTSFYYPFYDGKTGKLYFASNFEEGYGGTDIYYVYTNNGLIMSSPINLGPRINTPGNEIAPFIFEGSLYFSSDVFYGLGGMDTYKSDILEDDVYSLPVNLGKGLNSENDDFGFIIRNYGENSLLGYFASNRPGGKGNDDLYGFIIEDKPGVKTISLSGSIVNLSTNEKIPQAVVQLVDKEGKIIKEVQTYEKGDFRIEVPSRETITVRVTKDRHSVFSETFSGEALEEIQNSDLDLGIVRIDDIVEEIEDQTVLKLNKFYFERGQSKITPEIAAELDKVVDAVSRFPQLQLRIESHTDSRGGAATNFRISQSRADAIKDYLESNGVSPSNILYSIGYGEDRLLNDCTDGVFCLDTFHKKNERQLIVVLNYDLLF